MTRLRLGEDVREIAFPIGQTVYLRVAIEKRAGIVTGYVIDADSVLYRVSWADGDMLRYHFELADAWQPDFAKSAGDDA